MYKNVSKLGAVLFTNMISKIKSVKLNHFEIINTAKIKLHIIAVKTMRCCDADASAQTAQGRRDVLHFGEDSRPDDNRKEVPGAVTVLRDERARISENRLRGLKTGINLCISYSENS